MNVDKVQAMRSGINLHILLCRDLQKQLTEWQDSTSDQDYAKCQKLAINILASAKAITQSVSSEVII